MHPGRSEHAPSRAPRAVAVLCLLAATFVSGCLWDTKETPRAATPADVGYDPTTVHVLGVTVQNLTVTSWDGTTKLAVRAYVPALSGDARPPLVVFLHGWGNNKESYESGESYPVANPVGTGLPTGVNHLREFADAGFLAVAYDARGFGQSNGLATVAGPAEMADLHSILVWAQSTFPTNGRVGVIGASYGAGQAFNALADDPLVTTVVPMYGWVDLYQALVTGNVPKLEWAQFLYLYGQGGAGHYDPIIHEWYSDLYLRGVPAPAGEDLSTLRSQMDARSSLARLPASHKPLLVCQGMEESLFPQVDQAWTNAGGFTRAVVFRGGHGSAAPGCWARALDWFAFFLQGYDTGVDAWPALETVDAASDAVTNYAAFPDPTPAVYHLRSGELYQGPASEAPFAIQQTVAANPLEEPGALWDQVGMPTNALPDGLRQDPSALTFQSPLLTGGTLVGAPELTLTLHGESTTPYQVAGTLLVLHEDGTSQIVSRGAAAALRQDDVADGALHLRFHWTKMDLTPGDRIVLKVASNDPAWWMPLLNNYAVTFDGRSELSLPILA